MKTLRRTIHPEVRIVDEKNFIAEFIASDETIDSYNEIIRAAGWRFNRVQKNFPLVNSHDYSDIRNTLGKIIDYSVTGGRLINVAQYACDIAENQLALFAWKMLVGKYLPAVSVGFAPVRFASRWDSDRDAYNDQCADLKLPRETVPDVIYIEQEQLELSQCVIGANPNAVALIEKAYEAGVLNDSDITSFSKMSPDIGRAFERRNHRSRTYSFAPSAQPDAVAKMMKALGGDQSPNNQNSHTTMKKINPHNDFSRWSPENKSIFENLEFARRGQNETDLERAVRMAFTAQAREKHLSGDPVENYFKDHPIERYFFNGLARKMSGAGMEIASPEYQVLKSLAPGLVSGDPLGSSLFPITVSPDIFDLLLIYGAFRDLGVSQMPGQYTKFIKVTGLPAVYVYPSDVQGLATVPVDTKISGTNIGGAGAGEVCNTFISLVEASRELLSDQRVDLAGTLMRLFLQAISSSIDYCAFQGNGADDLINAQQTGIFVDANIKSYQPNIPGKSQINMLNRDDFINTIGVVAPAALQRPCRWYISPAFIPQLLHLKDGTGPAYLLKTPAETGGEWHLVGFPVTWAAAAPAIAGPNLKVAAFGEPSSYCVGIRDLFELMSSDAARFGGNVRQIRAIARGKCATRDATGFATLQLTNP